ncbi:unnamed protein product, partial [Phaeothamnion confervicola]
MRHLRLDEIEPPSPPRGPPPGLHQQQQQQQQHPVPEQLPSSLPPRGLPPVLPSGYPSGQGLPRRDLARTLEEIEADAGAPAPAPRAVPWMGDGASSLAVLAPLPGATVIAPPPGAPPRSAAAVAPLLPGAGAGLLPAVRPVSLEELERSIAGPADVCSTPPLPGLAAAPTAAAEEQRPGGGDSPASSSPQQQQQQSPATLSQQQLQQRLPRPPPPPSMFFVPGTPQLPPGMIMVPGRGPMPFPAGLLPAAVPGNFMSVFPPGGLPRGYGPPPPFIGISGMPPEMMPPGMFSPSMLPPGFFPAHMMPPRLPIPPQQQQLASPRSGGPQGNAAEEGGDATDGSAAAASGSPAPAGPPRRPPPPGSWQISPPPQGLFPPAAGLAVAQPLPPLPRGLLMTQHEVRFVINSQMRQLDTADPYNDDFYYHNSLRRQQEARSREAAAAAVTSGAGGGAGPEGPRPAFAPGRSGMAPLPLPVWQETKEMAARVRTEAQDKVDKRIRDWENENRVLGHNVKSSAHRPRVLVALSSERGHSFPEAFSSSDAGGGGCSGGKPKMFENHLWRARQAVQRANGALLAVQELRHLLNLPALPPQKRAALVAQLQGHIVGLGESLGLDRFVMDKLQAEAASKETDTDGVSELESTLNLQVLATVLELTKGQKLLARCITMLPSDQRWALAPSILALTLARPPAASLKSAPSERHKADAVAAEERLMRTLLGLMQSPRAPPPLPILSRCLQLVMAAHRDRRGSLGPALSARPRAEVMHAILNKAASIGNASARGRGAGAG